TGESIEMESASKAAVAVRPDFGRNHPQRLSNARIRQLIVGSAQARVGGKEDGTAESPSHFRAQARSPGSLPAAGPPPERQVTLGSRRDSCVRFEAVPSLTTG